MRGRLSHARASCVSRCASGNASSPARPGPLMCCSCSSDNTQQGHGRWSTDVVNSFRIWTGSPSCSCARDNFRPTTNTLLVYEGCLHGINSRSRLQVLSKKKCPTIYMQRRGFHGRYIVILLVVLVGTYPPGLFAQFRHGPIQPAQTLAKQQWSRGGPRALLTSLDVPIS